MQVLGSQGSTTDGTRYAFVLVAADFPTFDQYQDTTIGAAEVGLNNISIIGGSQSTTPNVNGTVLSNYTIDGLLFQNPSGTANTNIRGVLQNLQVANFPGNALIANFFSGELRGYNVFTAQSGGNCVDLQATSNPYRFYGLVASGCTDGLYLKGTQSEEFHGVSVFNNTIDVSVTGTRPRSESYILFDGAQFQASDLENMYLDQQNETVICAANCEFRDAGKNCAE